MQLSKNIKLLRQKSLMTQEDFAKELSVSPSTVNRWETGKACPNLTAMKKIKSFCSKNGLPYERIETEWLSHSEEE
jgi:DNA-binding transcriptional regulator YiaG